MCEVLSASRTGRALISADTDKIRNFKSSDGGSISIDMEDVLNCPMDAAILKEAEGYVERGDCYPSYGDVRRPPRQRAARSGRVRRCAR